MRTEGPGLELCLPGRAAVGWPGSARTCPGGWRDPIGSGAPLCTWHSLPAEGSVLRMRARGAPPRPSGSWAVVLNGSSLNASGRPGRTPWAASGPFPAAAVALSGCDANAGSLHRAGIKPKAGPSGERRPPGEVPTGTGRRCQGGDAAPGHLAEATEQVSGGAGI